MVLKVESLDREKVIPTDGEGTGEPGRPPACPPSRGDSESRAGQKPTCSSHKLSSGRAYTLSQQTSERSLPQQQEPRQGLHPESANLRTLSPTAGAPVSVKNDKQVSV